AKVSNNKIVFTKNDLGDSGISISFGNFQIYSFDLIYHLENKNLYPVSTEIALPPDTNYQKILIDNINPRPTNVSIDKDGNWLARYILSPNKSMDIKVLGKAKVYLNPKEEYLDPIMAKEYLKQNQYWDLENSKIKELAKDLKTPYAIYQYVYKTLGYDFSRVQSNSPRLGAANALKNPDSAVCLEFTDLFIAIARAVGIPAREINGYAYTSNSSQRPLSFVKDILHAWPEYYDYDKKTWIMIDPTWANTTGGVDYFNTLDFDHIAFVIKGLSSTYPVPAGGYKLSTDENKKDVGVSIDSAFKEKTANITSEILFPDLILSGLSINGSIKALNIGNSLVNKQEIKVSTSFLSPKSQSVFIKDIPPYGFQIISLNFDKTPILTNAKDTIKITAGNSNVLKHIKILPFYAHKIFILGGLAIASFSVIILLIAYIYRRLSLFKQKRESALRGQSQQFKE
nr:transglutaminase domain-containing protein [Candidatus Levybacteria bacterium]